MKSQRLELWLRSNMTPSTACSGLSIDPHSPANANNSVLFTSRHDGCFALPLRTHSSNPSAGIRHLRFVNGSRTAGFRRRCSDLALIVLTETDGSFAQDGMSRHLSRDNSPAKFLRILPDHRNRLSRSNVVTRRPVVIRNDVK